MSARSVLLLLAGSLTSCAATSCAATSGREWLEAPIDPAASSAQRAAAVSVEGEAAEARPRLRHTVTLGETYVALPDASVSGAGASGVQVNVTNNIVVNQPSGSGYGYGYGPGYAYHYGRGSAAGVSAAPIRATSGMPTTVGGDFPAPPDYGPRQLK